MYVRLRTVRTETPPYVVDFGKPKFVSGSRDDGVVALLFPCGGHYSSKSYCILQCTSRERESYWCILQAMGLINHTITSESRTHYFLLVFVSD